MASQHYSRSRELSKGAVKAEALLNRYPDLSEQELASLIRTFAHLPLLDFGLMAADERLGEKLDEFYRDHGDKLRAPLSGLSWAISLLAVLAIVLLVWAVA
jgi:hypothetical protein